MRSLCEQEDDKSGQEGGFSKRVSNSAKFQNIKTASRSDLVRQQIEEAIRRGQFEPGEALPSERELSQQFGVSRVSVREGIRSLEALGLVRVQQGKGYFVADRPTDGYVERFTEWLLVHREEVFELLRVRGALEELAAELASERAESGDLERIRVAHESFAAASEAGSPLDRIVDLDIAFHKTIVEASGSSLLIPLLEDLNSYLTESRRVMLAPGGRPQASSGEHAAIVEAILGGCGKDARSAVAAHIASVRKALIELENSSA